MADHIFDRQVRRQMPGRDLGFVQAGQQVFPAFEFLAEHRQDLLRVVHYGSPITIRCLSFNIVAAVLYLDQIA
jgi:hypothetical protein